MSAIQVVAFAVELLGAILTICCVALPYWKVNDPEDTIRDSIQRHEGLWLRCNSYSTGNWDCDDFNRFFLGLPTEMQAGRGLSLTSLALSVFSLIAMAVGMDSIPCGGDDKRMKSRIRLVSGCLAGLSGLMILAAVSWYANDVRLQHERVSQRLLVNSAESAYRYIFGYCLFLGWIGGVLLILAGLFALCTSCGGDSYEDAQPRYGYRPVVKTAGAGQEYV